jgi:glycerate 2-kinase
VNGDHVRIGELIRAATGADEVLVASGGSATVGGGSGTLQALAERPAGLGTPAPSCCAMGTTWRAGALTSTARKKGADEALVQQLTASLTAQAQTLPRNPTAVARTGAAGCLSGAVWAVYGAALESGAGRLLDPVQFNDRIKGSLAALAGEGKIDSRFEGKLDGEVTRRAGATECQFISSSAAGTSAKPRAEGLALLSSTRRQRWPRSPIVGGESRCSRGVPGL